MSGTIVETERLRLRVPGPGDRATLHGWFGDPAVMADLAPAMDEAGADAAIARHDSFRGEGLGFWLVERKTDGVAVGFCGLKRCNPGNPLAGRLEIGWIFGPEHWGKGYAREAAVACIAWAWDHCRENDIVAITARVNVKSQRLMERIGMHAEPSLDYHHPSFAEGDRLRDTVVFVIARPA
ncbi:GCN5 family acetyltransferase [Sphingomonas sp. Leaf357]|uniref:GNAT family N-acetyltransferase n=1 Tax=Sphingomonas sp. Leaf357 TaxID=1736350 RepID=UPI0006F39163|nr:GNAT family N-acetyltransferase [Sphingomonas sp. Leaf357]KQS04741.1 GCN5 family acetyltransferase [Sphingomonas sp. Leaf357]